jgi:anti-anti-sigma factor
MATKYPTADLPTHVLTKPTARELTGHDRLRPPLERNFEVDVKEESRGTVVTVSGELDVASSQALEHELAKLHGVATVVVDLRGLTFIDSTGLGVLVRAHQVAKEQGWRFGLVRGSGQVHRLLSLTGLDEELLVGDSTEQLLAGE